MSEHRSKEPPVFIRVRKGGFYDRQQKRREAIGMAAQRKKATAGAKKTSKKSRGGGQRTISPNDLFEPQEVTVKGETVMRSRNLSANKIQKALEEMGVDTYTFAETYCGMTVGRGRTTAVSSSQRDAVQKYLAGEMSRADAMEQAGIKTPGAFLNMIDRVQESEEE